MPEQDCQAQWLIFKAVAVEQPQVPPRAQEQAGWTTYFLRFWEERGLREANMQHFKMNLPEMRGETAGLNLVGNRDKAGREALQPVVGLQVPNYDQRWQGMWVFSMGQGGSGSCFWFSKGCHGLGIWI